MTTKRNLNFFFFSHHIAPSPQIHKYLESSSAVLSIIGFEYAPVIIIGLAWGCFVRDAIGSWVGLSSQLQLLLCGGAIVVGNYAVVV